MIVTVTLNSTVDIVVPVSTLDKGNVLRSPVIYGYPGGKGNNVARALASLGSRVTATGFSGKEDTDSLYKFLRKNKVKPDFVQVKGKNRPCILITEFKNRGETVINSESSFFVTPANRKSFLNKIERLSGRARIVSFSGSLPLSVPKSFYKTIIKRIRKHSIVLLDTSAAFLKEALSSSPHIIKQNKTELEAALCKKLNTKHKLKTAVRKLAGRYRIPTIIVTLNQAGAVLYENGKFTFFPSQKVKALSPVGSGDAFSAGLIHGISKGLSTQKACTLAMAAASANLSHTGSCFIRKQDILKFRRRIRFWPY